MELINEFREKYGPGDDDRYTASETQEIIGSIPDRFFSADHLRKIFSLLDLTTLNTAAN